MKLIDSLRLVWRNLWRMKLRTILTSVGVMIGTAAIVAMISLSIGLRENAVKSLENFGNLTELEVQPMYFDMEKQEPIPPDQVKPLNANSVLELKQVAGVTAVMPIKRMQAMVELKMGRREGNVELVGVEVREAAALKGQDVEKGEFLSGSANEIVISAELPKMMRDVEKEKREARLQAKNGQGGPDPRTRFMQGEEHNAAPAIDMVGKTATLVLTRQYFVDDEPKFERKEVRVRVVGQLKQEDDRRFGGGVAYVPMNLVNELNKWANPEGIDNGPFGFSPEEQSSRRSQRSRGQTQEIVFDGIFVKVESREQVEKVVEQIHALGYDIWSPAAALKEINRFFLIIQLILGGIAAISLLVASIGIINTMIMSILERTREIGIMKVIGATVYNIRWLFLIESGAIGLIGGLAGLGVAYGAVSILNYIARNNPSFNLFGGGPGQEAISQLAVIPLWLAWFAIGFSFLIGLLAGLLPAFRASRLSPLEAIRS